MFRHHVISWKFIAFDSPGCYHSVGDVCQLFSLFFIGLSFECNEASFAFIRYIIKLGLGRIYSLRLQLPGVKLDSLLRMKNEQWVEMCRSVWTIRNSTWGIQFGHLAAVGGEHREPRALLIGKLELFFIKGVLAESDAQCVQNGIFIIK